MFAARTAVSGTQDSALVYNGSSIDSVNRSSYTFSAAAVGNSPGSGAIRTVVFLILARSASQYTGPSVSTFSLSSGNPSQLVHMPITTTNGEVGTTLAAFTCTNVIGTTVDITVTFTHTVLHCCVYCYSLYSNSAFTPVFSAHEKKYDYLNGFATSLSLGMGGLWDYGPAIAMVYGDLGNSQTNTISGELTQRFAGKPVENTGLLFLADTERTNSLSFTTTATAASQQQHMFGFLVCFSPSSPPTPATTVSLTYNWVNPDLRSIGLSNGWDGTSRLKIIVNGAVTVSALSITQSFPNGLEIVNNGNIYGYNHTPLVGTTGSTGGTALYTRVPVLMTNYGNIWAGGGSGGGGGGGDIYANIDIVGSGRATGGRSQGCQPGTTTVQSNQTGQPGGYAEIGEPNDPVWWGYVQGGQGGSGGAWGEVGGKGYEAYGEANGLYYYDDSPAGLNGGNAGYFLDGGAYMGWLALGSRKGRVL